MSASHIATQPAELLAFLFASCPEVKRTKVRQWLKHGAVQVNGEWVTRGDHLLEAGDMVSVGSKREASAAGLLPQGMKVVFEDASLVVIEKPENLLSMASAGEREKTAYAFLAKYVGYRRGPRGAARVWIVHRLDRETSGLMIYAKTEAAKRRLQADWDIVEKHYLAVVEGQPPAEQGMLRSHLDESRTYKVHSAPAGERTRVAVTRYRVVQRGATCALLEVSLETGRRNQIRVQLADAGWPIVGDAKYGAVTNPAGRLALHASFLQFKHPLSGERLSFASPLPRKLARLV